MINLELEMTADEQLHVLLGRLVHAFGRLDFILGCQLQGLGPYRGQNVDHLLQRIVPFARRLEALEPLVMDVYGTRSKGARRDFSAWFQRVHEAKALRNDFAHGRWGITGRHSPAGVRFEFCILSWEFSAENQPAPTSYSPQELAAEVVNVEQLSHDFSLLEEAYRAYAKPSLAWETAQQLKP